MNKSLVFLCVLAATAADGLAQDPLTGAFRPIRFGDPDALAWDRPLIEGADPDPALPTPEELLGQPLGSRLARHAEVVEAFRTWSALSDRVALREHGVTHEGRPLVHAVITSPANHARLDALLASRLEAEVGAEPDAAADAAAFEGVPAVAWLGYSIHGDETSGTDASLAVAHWLASDRGEEVVGLMEELVVVVDPCQNPDGRERILGQLEQLAGYETDTDHTSMRRGRWPWGRGNHYYFDMNRDWIAGVAPETRGRWSAMLAFRPQLVVDAHEMGPLDTYLFYPQAAPHLPALPESLLRWQGVFADDHARAFDAFAWSYYTREWADAWGPFYTDAWASLTGAIGMLYEQAGTAGAPLVRASGEVVAYRESVHRQVVASLANLRTLRANRAAVLADWRRAIAAAEAPGEPWEGRALAVLPGRHPERVAALLGVLEGQGIEVRRVDGGGTLAAAVHSLGEERESLDLPAGAWLVPAAQAQGRLVRAYLGFDPRFDAESLAEERADLERGEGSSIYDVTAWDLVRALDLDAWWGAPGDLGLSDETAAPPADPPADAPAVAEPVAWALDGEPDPSLCFAARALELGLRVHCSDEPFTAAGRAFPRGSFLVRRHENEDDVDALVARAAAEAGVTPTPLGTARSPDAGPDLGGGHFALLERPRVALLGNAPVSPPAFGHAWHHLDTRVGVPVTVLDAQGFDGLDLRRYNVLVVPSSWGGARAFLDGRRETLASWVEAGGTLVAIGDAAAALTGEEGLSAVALLRDALDAAAGYRAAARRELLAGRGELDVAALWGGTLPPGDDGLGAQEAGFEAEGTEAPDGAEERDAWRRRFAPQGAILRATVDREHWVATGCGDALPVLVAGDHALLSRSPVETPLRLAEGPELRVAGLLWPEARERLALAAWCTVERRGAGQVVLFADDPCFRGYWLGTARVFANAVVLGPGLGASAPVPR